VVGHSLSSAVNALQALGLTVNTYGPGSNGVVIVTTPGAGTSVLPGTTVNVYFA